MVHKKKTMSLLLVLMMMLSALVTGVAVADDAAVDTVEENGVTINLSGYPIAAEPITITATVMYGSLRPDMDTTRVWDYVAEKTNIRFEVQLIKDQEKRDLMFASRDFTDVLFNVSITANQMADAAEGGDFIEMEPLLEQHAPTWYRFMKENPLVYNSSLASNGSLYSLPYIDFAPFDWDLRDQWIIMKTWLDELNLEVPTTTEEFKNVLLAFKENAGKGSIPEDVVPYYFFFDNYVGGQFDMYASFGVYITSADYLVVEDGVVKDQSTNPAIKEPLKYLAELYANGLIPTEVFTDDFTTYVSRISSEPAVVGSYGSYANRHQYTGGVAMGPLNAGNGATPYIRSQQYTPGPAHTAMITSNCDYPIAVTRFFEAMAADPELMLTVSRGIQSVLWDYDETGKAYQLFWEESPEKMAEFSSDLGLHNSFIALKDADFYENIWNEVAYGEENSRAWAYENVYKDVTMPNEMVYAPGTLSADDTNMLNQYKTDLTNYRKSMFADFITGKRDIDAEWDAFVAEMSRLGLNEFVALSQQSYDTVSK